MERTGRLTAADPRFEDASIDYYSVVLRDSTLVFLRLTSVDFDPFLYLFGPDRDVAAQSYDPHDAPAGASEAAILARDLAPGCHLIGATAWDAEGSGAYTIRFEVAQPIAGAGPP